MRCPEADRRRWRFGHRYVRVRLACDKACLIFAKGVAVSRQPTAKILLTATDDRAAQARGAPA
jgi:hypothetical protein